jgi:cell fate (sporulation/competence/biofilm development) regulator YlbF (YheA/YmcA/DUF963 family)
MREVKQMENLYDHAHHLARALRESDAFKAFQAAKAKIKGKGSAEAMIADFHKKQLELQTQALQGKEPTTEQKESLERLYGVISGDLDVREYLTAEQRFMVIINDVYKILGEAIDADYGRMT